MAQTRIHFSFIIQPLSFNGCFSSGYVYVLDAAEDFTTAGKKCATKGVFNKQLGLDCYVEIGNYIIISS